MRRPGRRAWLVILASLVATLAVAAVAQAHVTRASGPYRLEFGWGNEPPLAGSDNFVQVTVTTAAGAPVAVPAGALTVEVSYGREATTVPLVPTEKAGELRGELVPTLAGAYAFEITGALAGHTVDARAACGSQGSFECVEGASSADFPVKDPSASEIAQRLESESAQVDDARDHADRAMTLAIAALALAAVALAASAAMAVRRRRGSSGP
jgi:hypothetical protein